MRYPLNRFRIDDVRSFSSGYLDVDLVCMGDTRDRRWLLMRDPDGFWVGRHCTGDWEYRHFLPRKLVNLFVTWLIMTGAVSR